MDCCLQEFTVIFTVIISHCLVFIVFDLKIRLIKKLRKIFVLSYCFHLVCILYFHCLFHQCNLSSISMEAASFQNGSTLKSHCYFSTSLVQAQLCCWILTFTVVNFSCQLLFPTTNILLFNFSSSIVLLLLIIASK